MQSRESLLADLADVPEKLLSEASYGKIVVDRHLLNSLAELYTSPHASYGDHDGARRVVVSWLLDEDVSQCLSSAGRFYAATFEVSVLSADENTRKLAEKWLRYCCGGELFDVSEKFGKKSKSGQVLPDYNPDHWKDDDMVCLLLKSSLKDDKVFITMEILMFCLAVITNIVESRRCNRYVMEAIVGVFTRAFKFQLITAAWSLDSYRPAQDPKAPSIRKSRFACPDLKSVKANCLNDFTKSSLWPSYLKEVYGTNGMFSRPRQERYRARNPVVARTIEQLRVLHFAILPILKDCYPVHFGPRFVDVYFVALELELCNVTFVAQLVGVKDPLAWFIEDFHIGYCFKKNFICDNYSELQLLVLSLETQIRANNMNLVELIPFSDFAKDDLSHTKKAQKLLVESFKVYEMSSDEEEHEDKYEEKQKERNQALKKKKGRLLSRIQSVFRWLDYNGDYCEYCDHGRRTDRYCALCDMMYLELRDEKNCDHNMDFCRYWIRLSTKFVSRLQNGSDSFTEVCAILLEGLTKCEKRRLSTTKMWSYMPALFQVSRFVLSQTWIIDSNSSPLLWLRNIRLKISLPTDTLSEHCVYESLTLERYVATFVPFVVQFPVDEGNIWSLSYSRLEVWDGVMSLILKMMLAACQVVVGTCNVTCDPTEARHVIGRCLTLLNTMVTSKNPPKEPNQSLRLFFKCPALESDYLPSLSSGDMANIHTVITISQGMEQLQETSLKLYANVVSLYPSLFDVISIGFGMNVFKQYCNMDSVFVLGYVMRVLAEMNWYLKCPSSLMLLLTECCYRVTSDVVLDKIVRTLIPEKRAKARRKKDAAAIAIDDLLRQHWKPKSKEDIEEEAFFESLQSSLQQLNMCLNKSLPSDMQCRFVPDCEQ